MFEMIDIKELAIGSYLLDKEGNICPIFAINALTNSVILGGVNRSKGWQELELFSPIKLTHELLTIDNGFEYIDESIGWDVYRKDNISYSRYPTNSENITLCYNYEGGGYIKMKYLHQLQNFHNLFINKRWTIK